MSEFPFLFYGRRPDHWAEGANYGHVWFVRFAAVPSDADRRTCGAAFANAIAGSPVRFDRAYVDRRDGWLVLVAGEAEREGDGHFDRFFDGVAAGLGAVHAVAPLAEVIYGNTQAHGDHPWDEWSHARQPTPTACCGAALADGRLVERMDVLAYQSAYGDRCRQAPAIAVEPDREFAAGHEQGVTAIRDAGFRAAAEAAGSTGELALSPRDLGRRLGTPVSDEVKALIGPAAFVVATPGGRTFALVPDHEPLQLVYVDAGAGEVTATGMASARQRPVVSPDGRFVPGVADGFLCERAVDGGEVRRLWAAPDTGLVDVSYLSDRRLAALFHGRLAVLDRDPDGTGPADEVAAAPRTGSGCTGAGERFVMVRDHDTTRVFGIGRRTLADLGAIDIGVWDAETIDGQVVVADWRGNTYELVNLERRWTEALGDEPEAAPATEPEPAGLRLAVEPVDDPGPADRVEVEPTAEHREQFGDVVRLVRLASGRLVAQTPRKPFELAWIDPGKAKKTLTVQHRVSAWDVSPNEDYVLFEVFGKQSLGEIWFSDPGEGLVWTSVGNRRTAFPVEVGQAGLTSAAWLDDERVVFLFEDALCLIRRVAWPFSEVSWLTEVGGSKVVTALGRYALVTAGDSRIVIEIDGDGELTRLATIGLPASARCFTRAGQIYFEVDGQHFALR